MCDHIFMMLTMPNITLAIPDKIYEIIKKHKEIRWSEIARQAIIKYSTRLDLLDEIEYSEKIKLYNELLSQSKLTDKDILEIDEKLKQNILKHILER